MPALLIAALLSAPAAHADVKILPVYRQTVPAEFCASGKAINDKVDDCEGNKIFLDKMKECAAKLENLHQRVSNELAARMKLNQTDAQKTSFNSHQADTSEAVAAHNYMIKVTELAVAELDAYFDNVVYPEDAETDDDILGAGCYSNVVMPMDELLDGIEIKLEKMKAGQGLEAAHSAISGTNKQKIDNSSVNGLVQGGHAQGSGRVKGTSPNRDSDVSGTKENEQLRAKEKSK
jgi:hypothetical protein